MYSPKIDKHTPQLYRLSKLVGKPMTRVADELMSYSFKCLGEIYIELNEEEISSIFQVESE